MTTAIRHLRALIVLPLAILSAAASAITIHIESKGTAPEYAPLDGGQFLLVADHSAFDDQRTNPACAAFKEASFALLFLDGTAEGSQLAFRDGFDFNAPNQLNVELGLDADSTAGSIRTFAGNWRFNSGQGEYSDWSKKTSTGRWSFAWNKSNNTTRLIFDGNLLDRAAPVPEPAAFAPLGFAAITILCRKRR